MLRIFFPFLILSFFDSCKPNYIKDTSLGIIIEYAQSYKYNLTNGVYSVYFTVQPKSEIKISLSTEEKERVIDKYYDLDIDKIDAENKNTAITFFEDKCSTMPKLYTILHIKTSKRMQDIKIDQDCDDFYFSDSNKAYNVKKFIHFIEKLLKSKPEFLNVPSSNIIYL
jgi:hypothetical protein